MNVAPEAITPENWAEIEALLRPAVARSDTTIEALIDDLLNDRGQLWVVRDGEKAIAACITQLFDFPRQRVLHCELLGGSLLHEWLDPLIDAILIQAKRIGVQKFTLQGRRGWERVLAKRGWTPKAVVMEMPLG